MKWNASTVAIVLSILAIVISSAQPTYNFLVAQNLLRWGKSSFDVSDLGVYNYYTAITLKNNGTSKAHNIEVRLTFTHRMRIVGGLQSPRASQEFVPELHKNDSVILVFPIGRFDLAQDIPKNTSRLDWYLFDGWARYDIDVYVLCNELEQTKHFHLNYTFPFG